MKHPHPATRALMFALAVATFTLAPALSTEAAEPTAAEREQLEKERAAAREALRDATRRLRDAERALDSDRRLRAVERVRISDRAMLGVTVDDDTDRKDRDDGVRLAGVSPGGPSAEVGLKAGDLVVAINGKSLKADKEGRPFEKLRGVLDTVKPGEQVTLKVRRDGKTNDYKVTTEAFGARRFAFVFDGDGAVDLSGVEELGGLMELWMPESPGAAPRAPLPPMPFMHRFSRVWSDLEMVSLSESLGRYFGAKQGVLVVRAPEGEGPQMQDGDVILSVGGREATSPEQVMRVLRSYAPGEQIRLEVMRDRKKITVDGKLPEGRVMRPGRAPEAPRAPRADGAPL